MTRTTRRAMLKEFIWSKLAWSCLFSQESRFAKREDSLQAGSWVGVRAQVAVDEVDQVVGDVEQALQEVADAAGTSQVAKPEEQGLPPGLPGLTDHLHLPRHEICKSHGEQNKNKPGGVRGRSTSPQPRPPWSPPSEFKFRV